MSTAQRIGQEFREIGLVTLYFLACLLFFLLLKKLLLDEYDVQTTVIGTAVVGALVIAKVVVLLEKTSLATRFGSSILFVRVFLRSLVYTIAVFAVTVAEHLFSLYRELGELPAAASKLRAGEDFDHVLALNLCVGLSLLAYNLFREVSCHLGEDGLRKLLFSRR